MKRQTAFFDGQDYTAAELRAVISSTQAELDNDDDFPVPPKARRVLEQRIAEATAKLSTID